MTRLVVRAVSFESYRKMTLLTLAHPRKILCKKGKNRKRKQDNRGCVHGVLWYVFLCCVSPTKNRKIKKNEKRILKKKNKHLQRDLLGHDKKKHYVLAPPAPIKERQPAATAGRQTKPSTTLSSNSRKTSKFNVSTMTGYQSRPTGCKLAYPRKCSRLLVPGFQPGG